MITDQLNTPTGVASGKIVTFDLDVPNLYRELWTRVTCAAGDKTFSEIVDDIWLEVNGRPQRTHSAAELHAINLNMDDNLGVKTSGSVGTNDLVSYIPLFLAEDFRKNVERGLGLGWNAVGIRDLKLKLQLNTITSPDVSGWGTWDTPDLSRGLGAITKWKRQDLTATGSPQDFAKVFDVDPSRDNFLQSVHIFPTSTGTVRYVTEAELKLNGGTIHKRTFLQNASVLSAKAMNPDGDANPRYDLVLDESDSINDLRNLRNVTKQNLKLTFSGAPNGSMRIITLETGAPE